MVPLNETRLYTEDWIGLKAIDEVFSPNSLAFFLAFIYVTNFKLWLLHLCKFFFQAGKLHLMEVPGDHLQLSQVSEKPLPSPWSGVAAKEV